MILNQELKTDRKGRSHYDTTEDDRHISKHNGKNIIHSEEIELLPPYVIQVHSVPSWNDMMECEGLMQRL